MLPEMNHSSSAMTARRKTRFVVRRGRTGVGGALRSDEGRDREKRSCGGAKRERVPVPVLMENHYQCAATRMTVAMIPIGTMLAMLKNFTDKI